MKIKKECCLRHRRCSVLNLLKACEDGTSFVDKYPSSPAASPLNSIVDKLILALPVEDDEEGGDEVMQE